MNLTEKCKLNYLKRIILKEGNFKNDQKRNMGKVGKKTRKSISYQSKGKNVERDYSRNV